MPEVLLPHKLSELAQIALEDVQSLNDRDGFVIIMGEWYTPDPDVGCAVCAAGSVMVERLRYRGRAINTWPQILETFGEHNGRALLAVDAVRRGNVGAALAILQPDGDSNAWERAIWQRTPFLHPLNRDLSVTEDDLDSFRDGGDGAPEVPRLDQEWFEKQAQLIADLREAGL